MSAYPITPNLTIYFTEGATFGYPFTIGDPKNGIIGSSTLGSSTNDGLVVDISSQTVRAQISMGYNLLQQSFQAGQATFRIVDPNGYWNPTNTSSPYYGYLTPLRKVRFSATYNNTGYFLFSGYITSYNYTYPKDQEIGYVDLVCADAFRLLNLAGITTVSGTSAGQTTGTRIGKILDQISFPTSLRQIESGSTTVQADPATGRTALAAIQNCEFSEQGAFYIDGGGNAVFKSRLTVEKAAAATPTKFANNGTGIPYFNINPVFDDKLIINQATITRVGGTAQSATNSASVSKYFPHSVNYGNLMVQTDADALDIARAYVATRAETTLRVDSITLDLTTPSYNDGILAALDFDYFQNVQVVNVGQDGSTIDKTLQVVGITHDVTPNSWKTSFTLSEPLVDAFIIGNAQYGIIGVSAMTY
jgi:hypothetical protein